MMTYDNLINMLRDKGNVAKSLAQEIQSEVTREWDSGSSPSVRRAKQYSSKAYFAKTVSELMTMAQPLVEKDTEDDYKIDLARRVADALNGKIEEPELEPEPEVEPVAAEPVIELATTEEVEPEAKQRRQTKNQLKECINVISRGVRGGEKLRIDYDDVFTARVGNIIVDGKTIEEALVDLAAKLKELGQATSAE